jgi:hypothetical protein
LWEVKYPEAQAGVKAIFRGIGRKERKQIRSKRKRLASVYWCHYLSPPMSPALRHFLPLCTALLLPACALLHLKRKPHDPPPAAPAPLLIGTVILVDEAAHYVLIDTGMSPSPSPGALLKCYTGTAISGELVCDAMRRHPFVTADISSGYPQKGDRVFLEPRHGDAAVAPPAIPVQGGTPAPRTKFENPYELPPQMR